LVDLIAEEISDGRVLQLIRSCSKKLEVGTQPEPVVAISWYARILLGCYFCAASLRRSMSSEPVKQCSKC